MTLLYAFTETFQSKAISYQKKTDFKILKLLYINKVIQVKSTRFNIKQLLIFRSCDGEKHSSY